MKKQFLVLLSFLLPLFVGSGCAKEQPFENELIGAWLEIDPCNDGQCDTLVFNINKTIGYYKPFIGWYYNLLSDDSIEIFRDSEQTYKFRFSLVNKNEIIIYNFIDQSITNQAKNISFQSIILP